MQTPVKPSTKSIDVNAKIIANLDALNAAHLEDKAVCFSKGIPFYTCVDSGNKIWTKELKNGKMFRVRRHLDLEKDVMIDTLID
jgi:hypothetical protein